MASAHAAKAHTALALYPAKRCLPRAHIKLHRAGSLIGAGDADTGTQHAMQILEALPSTHRKDATMGRAAFMSLNLASSKDARRPAVRDACAMLAATPARWPGEPPSSRCVRIVRRAQARRAKRTMQAAGR